MGIENQVVFVIRDLMLDIMNTARDSDNSQLQFEMYVNCAVCLHSYRYRYTWWSQRWNYAFLP